MNASENLVAKNGSGGDVFDEFFELSNGCICCSVRDDLVNTLERLLERRYWSNLRLTNTEVYQFSHTRNKFDYILVETTGMANPGPIASIFWLDDELESRLYLDGIVTLVDSKHVVRHLDSAKASGKCNEAFLQIAFADRIILNKQVGVCSFVSLLSIRECNVCLVYHASSSIL
jgi:G3E family GTPase